MSLTNTLIIAFAIVFLIIGLHQSLLIGIQDSYWIFMLCISMLFLYKYRTMKAADQEQQAPPQKKSASARRKKSSK